MQNNRHPLPVLEISGKDNELLISVVGQSPQPGARDASREARGAGVPDFLASSKINGFQPFRWSGPFPKGCLQLNHCQVRDASLDEGKDGSPGYDGKCRFL
nr:hypothetical protein [Bacteroidota bacterium]